MTEPGSRAWLRGTSGALKSIRVHDGQEGGGAAHDGVVGGETEGAFPFATHAGCSYRVVVAADATPAIAGGSR